MTSRSNFTPRLESSRTGLSNGVWILEIGSVVWEITGVDTPPPPTDCVTRQIRRARFVGRGRKGQNKGSIPLKSWRLADSRNVFFFENLPTPFFGNVVFIKFGTFSALLALPLIYGRNAGKWHIKRFLTSCSVTLAWLRSHASLGLSMTTHLSRARWVTAARVPLPHWRTESRLCRHPRPTPAVHSPAYLAAFARFPNKRLIAVGNWSAMWKTTYPCS